MVSLASLHGVNLWVWRAFLGMLREDVLDIVATVFAKDLSQALGAVDPLSRETFLVFAVDFWRLLAVADHVDDWLGGSIAVGVVMSGLV